MSFEYVPKGEYQPFKLEVDEILRKMQRFLRENKILTFQFNLIGSAGRKFITRVKNGNKGFDLDYNIVIQKIFDEKYEKPKLLKETFIKLFNEYFDNSYDYAEDSTSVITVKKLNVNRNKILHSVDFAIVSYYEDKDGKERQEYVRFDKNTNTYSWVLRKVATDHRYVEDLIKEKNVWQDVKDLYLENKNKEPEKKSRIVYYQTLETIYKRNFQWNLSLHQVGIFFIFL